jgi:hypothetical protein
MIDVDQLNEELDTKIDRLNAEIKFATSDLERSYTIRNCNHLWKKEPHWANSMVSVVSCERCGYSEEQL